VLTTTKGSVQVAGRIYQSTEWASNKKEAEKNAALEALMNLTTDLHKAQSAQEGIACCITDT
jgi:hypothetical protein